MLQRSWSLTYVKNSTAAYQLHPVTLRCELYRSETHCKELGEFVITSLYDFIAVLSTVLDGATF